MTTLFALFAEVERDLISERTREGLAKARSSGKKLGRPKGSLGVSKSAIAKITGVSRPTLYHFIGTRGLSLDPYSAFLHESGQYPYFGAVAGANAPAFVERSRPRQARWSCQR